MEKTLFSQVLINPHTTTPLYKGLSPSLVISYDWHDGIDLEVRSPVYDAERAEIARCPLTFLAGLSQGWGL